MRVAIDATALGSTRGGDETYTRAVIAGLAEVCDPNQDCFPLVLHRGAALPSAVRGNPMFPLHEIPPQSRLRRYLVTLPRLVKERGDLDLLFTMIHAPFTARVPIALYLPDLSFRHMPAYFPRATRLRLSLLVPLHIRMARIVITVSEYSRRDIIATYRVPAERVAVVPNAAWPPGAPDGAGDGGSEDDHDALARVTPPYFLYLGNLHPRKNVPRLIAAFARARAAEPALARHRLVIAGGRWWGSGEEQAARMAPPGSVTFLGRVTNSAREALLSRAEALVYPSLFEGFGLPPLEAMAVGTAVVASNQTSIPEVVGDAGLLVDPLDESALAQALVRVGTDAGLRAELGRRGRERAARYQPRAAGAAARQAFFAALTHDS